MVAITDERISDLLLLNKQVTNRNARNVEEGKHWKRDYQVVSVDTDDDFAIFVRQHREMVDNFSVGLIWHSKTGESVTLLRCNGASHPHTNHIEGTKFGIGNYHVHMATERYLEIGKNSEHYAEVTAVYNTVNGALHHLCRECRIDGLDTKPDELDLFR